MRRGHRRVLAVMPTGSGKGTTIAYMVAEAVRRGRRTLILAHRTQLVEDLSERISGFGIPHGIIASGQPENLEHLVQVGSVQTVARRLDRIPGPSMIIQDEAHHLVVGNIWGNVIDQWPQAFLIGKTATPERLSGEGLGEGHGGYFTDMVLGPDVSWLTSNINPVTGQPYLMPARVFAPPGIDLTGIRNFDTRKGKDEAEARIRQSMGDPISHYRRAIEGEHNGTAIAFCVSVASAAATAEAFRSSGIAAASLDGSLHRISQRQLMQDLACGTLKVLTSCELISEGVDIPSVAGTILLRPTDSLALYLQQVGRALRPCPGKTRATVLDHVGNALRHGLPQDPREWSLEGRRKRPRHGEAAVGVRQCEVCFCCYTPTLPACPECGAMPVAKPRRLQQTAGELREIEAVERRARRKEQGQARTLAELVAVGKARGMRNPWGWAQRVMAGRGGHSGC